YEVNYESKPGGNTALVNIGAGTININILNSGVSVFTRYSPVGSNLHTEAIQREFGISYNDSERLKRGESIEGIPKENVAPAVNSASEDIIAEIARSFDYFRGATNENDIHEIILSGGCALIKDFASLLNEKIGIDVKIIEPFKNIQIPENFDKANLKKMGTIAVVALGLALRRLGDR
ncbi:MAG: pilus assembly protein PilM, partial [Nitrospirae bacterium]|nr:pilus assembly protein PilM [Nitrospirota bacterium]